MAAYGESFINIGFSVLLVSQYGLIGVAAATLAATWFRFVYYVIYLSRNIFCRSIRLFAKRSLINVALVAANYGLGSCIVSAFPVGNYISWACCGAVLVVALSVTTLGTNLCFFRKDCMRLVRKYIK